MNFRKNIFLLFLITFSTATILNGFEFNDNDDQEFDEFAFEMPEGINQQPQTRGEILPIFAQFALQIENSKQRLIKLNIAFLHHSALLAINEVHRFYCILR